MPDNLPEPNLSEQVLPEPWLRGILPDVEPVIGHLLRVSQQIQEEMERALDGLSSAQLWARPHNMTSVGFHAKHLAGSTERLCNYLEGRQLSADQVAALASENAGPESAAELLTGIQVALGRYELIVRNLAREDFASVREVGRRRLPTTAVSLAIHIGEHGQRHVGQAICAAKLARATISA